MSFSYCYSPRISARQWCAFSSTNLGIKTSSTGTQRAGKGVPVDPGKNLFITCPYLRRKMITSNIQLDKYDTASGKFTQSLTMDGRQLSTQSMAVGKGVRFNTAVEVQGGFKGTVYGHSRFQKSTKMAAHLHESVPKHNNQICCS
jgi:hypothetical protein